MSSFSQKDIQLLFVGGNAAATTGAIDAMNDGEIGIFTPAGKRVTEATAATVEKFIIVKKTPNSGVPLISSVINKKDIKRLSRKEYVAATDQVVTVGYDGANGSIDAVNDNEYKLTISFREGLTSNHGGLYLKHGFYKSDINATQYEVGTNMLRSVSDNFSKEAEELILAELLCNDAGAATTGTVSVVKGSKVVVATVPGEFAVGSLLRLGTATTDACYQVVSIVGNAITLDTPITVSTQTFAIGAAEFITPALAAVADFGIRLTAVPSAHVVGKLHGNLQPLLFDVTLGAFGITPNVLATPGTAGNGTQKQVQELEWFCQGNEGDFYRIGEPNLITPRTEATGNYDLIDMQIEEIYTGSITSGPIHKAYTLAIPEAAPAYALAGTADDITDVLEILKNGAVDGSLAVA